MPPHRRRLKPQFSLCILVEKKVDDVMIPVYSVSDPAMLVLTPSKSTIQDDESVMVTIMLRAEDGTAAADVEGDTKVTLDPGTGMFSMTDGGDAITTADIIRGESQVIVFYRNQVLGEGSIMASAEGLTPDDADIETNPKTTEVNLIGVVPDIAKLETEVTVTAQGTEKQTAMLYIGAEGIVINGTDMDEGPDGTYTHTFTVNDTHGGGTHDVKVVLNKGEANTSETPVGAGTLTIDKTAPMITDDSLSVDMPTVKTGDTVVISAMAEGATTVYADASGLNADATMVDLAEGTGPVMVTADGDGPVEITVRATDDAGNSDMATITVTLDNTAPMITDDSLSVDMTDVKAGDTVIISVMVDGATSVYADASGLNADAAMVSLTDSDEDGMYESEGVMVTDGGDGPVEITVRATDDVGNEVMATAMVTLDNTMPTITDPSADSMDVKTGDTVIISAMVAGATSVYADASGLNAGAAMVSLTDADEDGMYESEGVMVTADGDGPVEITVTATDAAGNAADPATGTVNLDNTPPTVAASDIGGMVKNEQMVAISAEVGDGDGSGVASVMANLSALDTAADPAEVALMDDDGDGTYTYEHTISEGNEADNGTHAVTITATDAAGNEASDDAMVTLQNTLFYTSTLEGGTVTLFHVPLDVEGLDTVGDLKAEFGGDENVSLIAGVFDGAWDFAGDDVAITADLGLLVNVRADTSVTFEGRPWGEGASMINLTGGGLNLVGLPLNDDRVTNVSGIMDNL